MRGADERGPAQSLAFSPSEPPVGRPTRRASARALSPFGMALGLACGFAATLGGERAPVAEATPRPAIAAPAPLGAMYAATPGLAGAAGSAAAALAAGQAAVDLVGRAARAPEASAGAISPSGIGRSLAIGPIGVRAPYRAPDHSLAALRDVPFRAGRAIDERYRAAFAECDGTDRFLGRALGRGACSQEPNLFDAFLRLPAAEVGAGAVYVDAALALETAGSWAACGRGGARPIDMQACATFFDYPDMPSEAYRRLDESWSRLFVSSDRVPFLTIPAAAPPGPDSLAQGRAFADASGVEVGDVGVVIYRDRVVPVLIAHGGPTHRALGGSLALFDALGVGRCRERLAADPTLCADIKDYGLGANVVAVVFPGSRIEGLTAETTLERVRAVALERFTNLVAGGEALAAAGLDDGAVRAPTPRPSPRIALAARQIAGARSGAGAGADDAVPARQSVAVVGAGVAERLGLTAPDPESRRMPEPPDADALRAALGAGRSLTAPLLAPSPTRRPAGSAIVLSAAASAVYAGRPIADAALGDSGPRIAPGAAPGFAPGLAPSPRRRPPLR